MEVETEPRPNVEGEAPDTEVVKEEADMEIAEGAEGAEGATREPVEGEVKEEASGGAEKVEEEPPLPEDANETIYIQNLNERVKIPVLKQSLQALFSTYGRVLSVVAHRNLRMRGQAFVSFADKATAAKAVRDVKGFPLYGKPMQIAFSRTRSDVVVKKLDAEHFDDHKKSRLERKKISRRDNVLRRKELARKIAEKTAAAAGTPTDAAAAAVAGAAKRAPAHAMPDEYLPPNKILFLQGLPEGVGRDSLTELFGAYPNLVEVRTIPGKASIAFVEYTDEASSAAARDVLNGYSFGSGGGEGDAEEARMKVTFARQ